MSAIEQTVHYNQKNGYIKRNYTETCTVELKVTGNEEKDELEYMIFLFAQEIMEGVEPKISMENDGIGSYEYWGMKGYDAGTTYALVEGNDYGDVVLLVPINNLNPEETIKLIEECDFDEVRKQLESEAYPDLYLKVEVSRKLLFDNGKKFAEFRLNWIDADQ